MTFHDSCYLARYNDVVAAAARGPGAVAGLELVEMERSGKNSFCCGAGGGRMWMEETRGTRINAERTRQALETGADTVATACPFCMTMMSDGLAAAESNAAGTVKRRRHRRDPGGRPRAERRPAGSCRSIRVSGPA